MTTAGTTSPGTQTYQYEALQDDLTQELEVLVRTKIRSLVGTYGFLPADYDDLTQEVTTDLLRRLASYDPSRGSMITFSSRVIDHKIASLIQRQKAAVRDCRVGPLSLEDLPEELCSEEIAQQHRSRLAAEDLRIDLEKMLSVLPQALGAVCQLMRELAGADRSPGGCLSRKAFQTATQRLGREFKRAGLHEYL